MTRRFVRTGFGTVCALAAFAAALGAPRAAAQLDDFRRNLQEQRKNQEKYIRNLKPLFDDGSKRAFSDLLVVGLEDGRLTFKSPLIESLPDGRNGGGQYRAEIQGFDSPFLVSFHRVGRRGTQGWTLSITQTTFPNDAGTQTLFLTAHPETLQFARHFYSQDRNYNITLSQTRGQAQFGMPDGVTFGINRAGANGRDAFNFGVTEPDFLALRREHPREVNEYLRPFLREIGMGSLFQVEATTAWQAFPRQWKPDAALERRVRDLLPALDAERFDDRRRASAALRAMGPPGALAIYFFPRDGLTPEQERRLDAAVTGHQLVGRDEARRLADDLDFLLDCLYGEDAAVRAVALAQLRRVCGRPVAFDPDAPRDVRVARVEALRRELAPSATTAQPGTSAAATTRPGRGG